MPIPAFDCPVPQLFHQAVLIDVDLRRFWPGFGQWFRSAAVGRNDRDRRITCECWDVFTS